LYPELPFQLVPCPRWADGSLSFRIDGRVTSLDITPDGCYVIAGCSDGTVRLYSLAPAHSRWGHEGILLGQIHAKGLITNLIFHVEVTGDGRFAFAGVMKGSTEMMAYDLGRLPSAGHGGTLSKETAETMIDSFTNLDPKLRGFGAASKLAGAGAEEDERCEYRLICGMGIKNLHIWSFRPPTVEGGEPEWECIFDRATNGMSIELLGVRNGGREAVSKSNGQCVRVWSLTTESDNENDAAEGSPGGSSVGSGGGGGGGGARAAYKDVNNTQDALAILSDFAFGGATQLALVKLDAQAVANRMEVALPSVPGNGVKQKRRQLCSIKEVIGTHDGTHVVVICSDGSVFYYERDSTSAAGELILLPGLTVPEDEDCTFSLAQVGSRQQVVVVKSRWLASDRCGEISVKPLSIVPRAARGEGSGPDPQPQRKALKEMDTNKNITAPPGADESPDATAKAAGKPPMPTTEKEKRPPATTKPSAGDGAPKVKRKSKDGNKDGRGPGRPPKERAPSSAGQAGDGGEPKPPRRQAPPPLPAEAFKRPKPFDPFLVMKTKRARGPEGGGKLPASTRHAREEEASRLTERFAHQVRGDALVSAGGDDDDDA
jgi:WD40 repeat protein